MDAQKCGEFITELRKEKNLTQKDLANELNVSDKAISRWETGKGFPDVDSLQSLSKFFSVTINELLAGEKAETKTIEEIAEENIISVINETEKNKKSKKTMTVLSIILALILIRDCLRAPDQRIGQYTGYAYCLMGVQLCSTTPEIFLCSGFYSKYSLAGLCNIQIHLHDPLLAPKEFNQDSIIGFKSFTPPTVATEGKAVLGNLLGYSAAAPDLLALLLMFVLHLDKFLDVKAPVLHEAAVLGRHYSTDHNR